MIRRSMPGRRVPMDGFLALYVFMLAAFTGYEIIGRVPVILHTPLMSGSNFVHGIVLVGAMAILPLILLALVTGVGLAWWSGKRVAMTDMPQMVALYNGMGGGSAAAIGAVELLRLAAERGGTAAVADSFFTAAAPAQH